MIDWIIYISILIGKSVTVSLNCQSCKLTMASYRSSVDKGKYTLTINLYIFTRSQVTIQSIIKNRFIQLALFSVIWINKQKLTPLPPMVCNIRLTKRKFLDFQFIEKNETTSNHLKMLKHCISQLYSSSCSSVSDSNTVENSQKLPWVPLHRLTKIERG